MATKIVYRKPMHKPFSDIKVGEFFMSIVEYQCVYLKTDHAHAYSFDSQVVIPWNADTQVQDIDATIIIHPVKIQE